VDLQPPPALKGAARRRLRLLPLPLVVLVALMLTAGGGPWPTVSVSRRPEGELTIFQAINPPNGELGLELEVEGVALRSAGSVIFQIR
jgi:hypothetical protein